VRAARCLQYGPPSSVVVEDVPDPVASEGQVVVEVAAAAVNFPDVLLVADQYQIHIPVPFTVGSEFAGTVRAVGAGVDGVAVGDRVMGSTLFGAFAEQIAVPASSLQPVDPAVELATAAASGVAHATAYHALRSVARVQPGEWVVVLGAAGGVGLAAVELGAVLGARMVAAASSAEKTALCLARGAEVAVDYTTEDLKARVKEITGGKLCDVVYDSIGKATFPAALDCIRPLGLFVSFGSASGQIEAFNINLLQAKGSLFATRPTLNTYGAKREDLLAMASDLFAVVGSGAVKIPINQKYKLSDAQQAHRDLESRATTGSSILLP